LILKDDDKMVSQEVSTAKGVQRSQLVASSEDDIEEEGEEEEEGRRVVERSMQYMA
jgi:hypothetical protein